jgi:hypothetical protein
VQEKFIAEFEDCVGNRFDKMQQIVTAMGTVISNAQQEIRNLTEAGGDNVRESRAGIGSIGGVVSQQSIGNAGGNLSSASQTNTILQQAAQLREKQALTERKKRICMGFLERFRLPEKDLERIKSTEHPIDTNSSRRLRKSRQ